ncbi:unnamed protein product [Caenorhabditis sp. 36 PRJEB53466]|nr:unnamed protein product [Caenorhabditis sp. 36 PRJEB53466]
MPQMIRIKMHDKELSFVLSKSVLAKSSIKSAFLLVDEAILSLSYELTGVEIHCEMNEKGTTFILPEDFSKMQFNVESDKAPSRPSTPADVEGPTPRKWRKIDLELEPEHKNAITDISTCRYDEITVSADSRGELIIWQKPVKGVNSRITTKQNINVINVLRKQIIVGTLRGLVQYYSITTGNLMCQVNAHSRPINSVSVAPESAYVLTSSEDGTFIVSKLHTRKPHAYQSGGIRNVTPLHQLLELSLQMDVEVL